MLNESSTQSTPCIPAAQYVRMSTEDQQYSIDSQKEGIREYAAKNGFSIVQTYEDAGKSGVVLRHREGLLKLLQDVLTVKVPYKAILVYDISRWGRFQDIDEAAYYEFICKSAGIPVHYCAEQFPNDETLFSSLVKALKRSMAAEFSRELGVKVFNGKKKIVQLGFRVGGEAGYGYQRLMLSADGRPRQRLKLGEHKSLTTDRITLIPGDRREIETVRYMFKLASETRLGTTEIAHKMNSSGMLFQGHSWSNVQVANVLTNPKYAGWNVWARRSQRLGGKVTMTPPENWIGKPGAFPAIVDQVTFDRVQRNLIRRADREWSDEEIRKRLKQLLVAKGRLSEEIIKKARGMCATNTLRRRFGGYQEIYDMVGYHPQFRDFFRGARAESSMCVRRELVERIGAMFPEHVKIMQQRMRTRSILWIDDAFYVAVLMCRHIKGNKKDRPKPHWIVAPNPSEYDYMTLVCLLNSTNNGVLSFHVFSRMNLIYRRLFHGNRWLTQGKRLNDLRDFYSLVTTMRNAPSNDPMG